MSYYIYKKDGRYESELAAMLGFERKKDKLKEMGIEKIILELTPLNVATVKPEQEVSIIVNKLNNDKIEPNYDSIMGYLKQHRIGKSGVDKTKEYWPFRNIRIVDESGDLRDMKSIKKEQLKLGKKDSGVYYVFNSSNKFRYVHVKELELPATNNNGVLVRAKPCKDGTLEAEKMMSNLVEILNKGASKEDNTNYLITGWKIGLKESNYWPFKEIKLYFN